MFLKKEARILILTQFPYAYVGIVIRGVKGFENCLLFTACSELIDFLRSRKGIAGEITYILVSEIDANCLEELKHLKRYGYKLIGLSDIIDRELKEAVEEAIDISRRVGVKIAELLVQLHRDDRGFKI